MRDRSAADGGIGVRDSPAEQLPGAASTMIRLDVSLLTKARPGASLDLSLETGPQYLTDIEVGFLRGTIRATRVENGVLVQGAVESELTFECVRCLEPFSMLTTLELEETFRLPGASSRPDMPYSVGSDGWVDLAPVLRELSWLNMPMKPLCGSECKGLCPQCGANLNVEPCRCGDTQIDPRWAVLKDAP